MKCARFDTESTTVITASCSEERGSSTTKSTLSVSHRESGIQRGYNLPTRAYLIGFVLMQRSQVLMYYLMYLDICGHQYFLETNSSVFQHLGYLATFVS